MSRSSLKWPPVTPATGRIVRADDLRRTLIGTSIGVAALVALWAWRARGEPELILPSPAETWRALVDIASDGTLLEQATLTFGRALFGVTLALVVGVAWGTLRGASRWVTAITEPALATLLSLPPIVFVVLGLTWFGPGAATTRLVIIAVAVPLIVVAVTEAVRNIDGDLLEMATAFELTRTAQLRHIVAPAVASPVLAATSVALAQSLRVAVMAELLSASDGIGAEVARARANIETADVFAWALVLIIVALAIELAVLRPATQRLLRWRQPASPA